MADSSNSQLMTLSERERINFKRCVEYNPRQLLNHSLRSRMAAASTFFSRKGDPDPSPDSISWLQLEPVELLDIYGKELREVTLSRLDQYIDEKILPTLERLCECVSTRIDLLKQQNREDHYQRLTEESDKLSNLVASLSNGRMYCDMLELSSGNYEQIEDLILGIQNKGFPNESKYEILLITLLPFSDAAKIIYLETVVGKDNAEKRAYQIRGGLHGFPFTKYDSFGISKIEDLESIDGVSVHDRRLDIWDKQKMVDISFPLYWDEIPESEFWGFENFLHEKTMQKVMKNENITPEDKERLALVLILNRYDFMRYRSGFRSPEYTPQILGVPSLPTHHLNAHPTK